MDEERTGPGAGDAPPDEDAPLTDVGAGVPPSRERVLEAAARVFAAEGLDAPMPAVAAAAGVGVGTIYRAFGSKDELVAALAAERVESFGRQAEAALHAGDAWEALVSLLERTADEQAGDYVLTEALAWIFDHPRVREAQQTASRHTRALLEQAKEQGRLRQDFAAEDLPMMFAALGAAQQALPRGSRAWTRLFTLMLDGLGPEGATDFTDPHLEPEEMEQASRERRERHERHGH